MALPAALSKEVGAGPLKLPLWGWAIAGVGGVLLARKITGGSSAAASTADTAPAEPAETGTDLPAGGVLTLGANGAIQVPGGALSPVASTITDNDAWRVAAINAMVTRTPPFDALFAANAVQKYLDGDRLTTAEQAAISYALTRIGPTPMLVPPSLPITTTPAPTPTKPPTIAPGPITIGQQSTPNVPKPSLPANHAPGEAFVDFANPPFGKGTWWLTNWGGVYAVGGAPYKGNPIRSRVAKVLGPGPAGQSFVSIEPFSTGYRIKDNRADTGDYVYR